MCITLEVAEDFFIQIVYKNIRKLELDRQTPPSLQNGPKTIRLCRLPVLEGAIIFVAAWIEQGSEDK